MSERVIIIGAGAAGMIAARALSEKGVEVTILESRQVCGGRIQSHAVPQKDSVVEGGAEFIHGNLPVTIGLCREAGISYVPVEGKMYRVRKGEWTEETDMIEGWDELIEKMGTVKEDQTLDAFFESNFADERYERLRRHARSFVQGFDLADPARVSVKALYEEWSHEEEENYRIPGGYKQLIDFLEQKCISHGTLVCRNDTVKTVRWKKGKVLVSTAAGREHRGSKLIVTVPLGVLISTDSASSISFIPSMDGQLSAARAIGYGTVIKVVLLFRKTFWKEDTRFIFSEQTFPTWWSQLPQSPLMLTGWLGGPPAARMSALSENDLLQAALLSLSAIFSVEMSELQQNIEQSFVFNWQNHQDALGAYSYPTPETAAAKKTMQTPVEETIFFAGEALYDGDYPGTVEAAFASGISVAGKVAAYL